MKQLITVNGEEVLVREDVAKKHRGLIWAMLSLLAFLLIMATLMFTGFFAAGDDVNETPRQIEQQRQ